MTKLNYTTTFKSDDSLVRDVHLKKCKSGIICVVFSTYDKWIGFHRLNDNSYHFWDGTEDEPTYREEKITVKLNLDSYNPKNFYTPTIQQEKDQIIFYYIPEKLVK